MQETGEQDRDIEAGSQDVVVYILFICALFEPSIGDAHSFASEEWHTISTSLSHFIRSKCISGHSSPILLIIVPALPRSSNVDQVAHARPILHR